MTIFISIKLAPCKLATCYESSIRWVYCKSCEIVDNLYNCSYHQNCLTALTNGWEVMCSCFAWNIKTLMKLTYKVMKYSKAYITSFVWLGSQRLLTTSLTSSKTVVALWSQCYKIYTISYVHSVHQLFSWSLLYTYQHNSTLQHKVNWYWGQNTATLLMHLSYFK